MGKPLEIVPNKSQRTPLTPEVIAADFMTWRQFDKHTQGKFEPLDNPLRGTLRSLQPVNADYRRQVEAVERYIDLNKYNIGGTDEAIGRMALNLRVFYNPEAVNALEQYAQRLLRAGINKEPARFNAKLAQLGTVFFTVHGGDQLAEQDAVDAERKGNHPLQAYGVRIGRLIGSVGFDADRTEMIFAVAGRSGAEYELLGTEQAGGHAFVEATRLHEPLNPAQ